MGAGSSKAQTTAAQNEAWRQSQIDNSVEAINSAYNNPKRESQIQDFLGASREYYTNELDRQKKVADRSTKFALARSGLTGGSASVDANRTLGENYQEGVLQADRLAQGAASDLRSADEQSRLNLISAAQQGADMTTSASRAASSLQSNLDSSNSSLSTDALGDIFSGLSNIWDSSQQNASQNRGYRDVYNLLYTPGFGYGGSK